MIARGDRVIAGVSGGADSVCLFFVLLELRGRLGFEFAAVHVNHGLRGEDADKDEEFVRGLCGRYKVPIEVFRVNLELIAKNRKQSLEEAGRHVRRESFLAAAKKHGANKIALAHHQNDNAETLLWNLCRGGGLDGMCGIRSVNGLYVRPLLCMTREEIEDFLRKRGQPYRTDETNGGMDYTRNRLRHLVLPVLEREVNSRSVRHMNESARQMSELREYVEGQAREALSECTAWEDGRCLIEKASFYAYPRILRSYVLRGCVVRLRGKLTDFGQVHVEALLALFEKQVGRKACLPGKLEARRVYGGVELRVMADGGSVHHGSGSVWNGAVRGGLDSAGNGAVRGGSDSAGSGAAWPETASEGIGGLRPDLVPDPREVRFLNIPGETYFPERNMVARCKVMERPARFSMEEIPENIYTKWFDYGIIKKGLCIRGRRPGDSIVIDKEGHAKKLKSWFVNEKVPADERAKIPLLACGRDILWIIGHRMSSAYQVGKGTRQILQVEVRIGSRVEAGMKH